MENNRLVQLQQSLREQGIEALLITGATNRKYITGFTGSAGYVIVTPDKAMLLTDFRYVEQAESQAIGFEIVKHDPKVAVTIQRLLTELHIRVLSFEQDFMTYGNYASYQEGLSGIELKPVKGIVEQLRMVKDAKEIEIIQTAANIADAAFSHILTVMRPGVTEAEVAFELEMFMRKQGATSTSFATIVASGERSALPHGVASERVMQAGDFVTLDFGALYQGYCSDITRTVVLGKATEKQKEIYNIVLEAQLYALEHLKPGMSGKEADALTRDIIARYGYGDNFGHSTGHGIGQDIHEGPWLAHSSDMILKPGMVVTIEPGIYLPAFGGVRIEDDVLIMESGIKILTHSDKNLIELN